jgi:hypothetical protein
MLETFTVDADGALAREVVPGHGRPYRHRCPLAALEEVAHTIDEAGEQPVLLVPLARQLDLPYTRVNVALAFMKERGILVPADRRSHVQNNPGGTWLDTMTEYHALREGASTCGD